MSLATRTAAVAVAVGMVGTLGVASIPPAAASGSVATIHVAMKGSDSNPGSASRPLRTVGKAVAKAKPGTTIKVHKGTYAGQIRITKSGTPSRPIVLTTAGDGPVTLTTSPKRVSCGARKAALDRTIDIAKGSDDWVIRGFTIKNGITIRGAGAGPAYQWFAGKVNKGDWKARRAIPGRGSKNATAAKKAVSYVDQRTSGSLNPSDRIKIENNTITGRGIYGTLTRYGKISGNTIRDIHCGTGPGIWFVTFSDGWKIQGNQVRKVAASTFKHFMQEGIRLGSSSNYNVVTNNTVRDLPGDGRAFNTDVDSSFNSFLRNHAQGVAIGYNEQKGGWGNVWSSNSVSSYRKYGMGFRLATTQSGPPPMDVVSKNAVVSCNLVNGGGKDLGVGRTVGAKFTSNTMNGFWISKGAKPRWGADNNKWNGSGRLPSPSTTPSRCA